MEKLRDVMEKRKKSIEEKYGSDVALFSSGQKFEYTETIGKLRINLDLKVIERLT